MSRQLVHILVLLLLGAGAVHAQDVHFTQFFASPLTLNPAETANFLEDYRIGGNFKQQWPWAKDAKRHNYITYSAYADMAFLRGKLPKKDWIGGGLMVLHDRAGDGNLAITKIFVSAAYHKTLGKGDKYYLSFGINGGFVQKGVDYDNLYFDNQWNDQFFDLNTPNGENGSSAMYFDLGTGVGFSFAPKKNMRYSLGLGLMHLTRPKETFYDAAGNRLGMRPVANIQTNIRFNSRWHIEPSAMYMNQVRASEIVVNAMAGYTFNTRGKFTNSVFYFGTAYRYNDALVPISGFRIKSIKVLMNYDINLSSLQAASGNIGGFEFSVVHMGFLPGTATNRAVPCPRL